MDKSESLTNVSTVSQPLYLVKNHLVNADENGYIQLDNEIVSFLRSLVRL
jgi:hypothetical protein